MAVAEKRPPIMADGRFAVAVLRSMSRQLASQAVFAPAQETAALRKASRLTNEARHVLENLR